MQRMTKEEMGFRFTDITVGELDHPEIYARISKEATKRFFELDNVPPTNCDAVKDDSYIEGEVQFIFNADGKNLDEILIFPVYEDEEGGLINGADWANAPEWFWMFKEEALKELEKTIK